MEDNYFMKLFSVNVSDKIEKKNGLSYVSWPYAWAEVKKVFPDAVSTVYENKDGWNYHTDGRTCWVKTGLTVNGIEHIEYLPVMDYRNNAIPLEKVTSTDVNKAIQRSLTKAAARHGIGLYVYAGEDLPEAEKVATEAATEKAKPKAEVKPKADVTASEKAKVPPTNPVKAYVANELTFMKQMFNISDTKEMMAKFADMRKSLIAMDVIPDIPADKQSMEEAQTMIQEIYNHFSPSGAMKDVRTA